MGTAVRRVEDPELLTGRGTFVDNVALVGALHLVFVRSPMAHARLAGVHTAAAAAADGVAAVLTAADLGLPAHHTYMTANPDLPRPPLATDRVRFVGEAIAVVAAESAPAAADAAALVEVDYEPLPAVVDVEAAVAPDAPLQYPALGSNVAAGVRAPDRPDVLAGADIIVRARMVNQRVAVAPMEGNAIVVEPGAEGGLTIWVSTQLPHAFRAEVARLFGLAEERVRVIAPHVGGGFGGKVGVLAEHTVAIGVAHALGRPVRWTETRSENLVSMPHGRGQVAWYELGLRRDGRITGLHARVLGDAGAHAGFGGVLALITTAMMAQGAYDIPLLAYDAAAVLTNTTPTGAFRGAGRPEAASYIERMMDLAAAELGIDPVEIRRRNLITPDRFPFTTLTGVTYDVGDYDRPLREALRIADYPGLRARQVERRASGDPVQLGIGVSVYVEITSLGPGEEFGSVTVHADGSATVSAGTCAQGQGHATAFSMLVADRLGIPMVRIRFVQSDTALVPRGGGTSGSRSLQLGGSAVHAAAGRVLEQARERAAELLEADADDIELTDRGEFGVRGVPSSTVTWVQVAGGADLGATVDTGQDGSTFPFGAHLAVVEVDTETGRVTPVRHVAVDDCGRILNPLLVTGQQHGGLAQGIAQALYEEVLFDADGQPLTATLVGYHLPSAADLITFDTANTETPTPLNPLGAKGIGESATVGSTPAVQNAVIDALAPLGVRHLDLPCTPERVWRAIRAARAGDVADPWREPPSVFAGLPVRPSAAAPPAEGGGGD